MVNMNPTKSEELYYIASLRHTRKADDFITFWRADNAGYAWPLQWAGQYNRASVEAEMDYYHNGDRSIAVPVGVVSSLAVPPASGKVDGDTGPVVMNTAENWKALIAAMICAPAIPPKPEIFTKKDMA